MRTFLADFSFPFMDKNIFFVRENADSGQMRSFINKRTISK